jgi:zinc protease
MKRLLLVLVFCCAAAMAADTRIAVPYQRFVLPNGLTVILHEDHTTPSISVNIHYRVGSAREKPGRTGFAHLFEHIMFEGSGHVPEGAFDQWLEVVGGDNNASTGADRTNYYESIPSNALELPLFLESDRMGYLLDAMSPSKVDGQRDVVKNERRQSVENVPYGTASIVLDENLFPPGHPYHWPVIGSMEDLSAASYQDVVEFFKAYYTPNNASLCIAGDIDPVKARALVEKWFSDVPAGPPVPPPVAPVAFLSAEKRIVIEDKVTLPRLYMAWLSPAVLTPGDAELDIVASILTDGMNSRLYKRLVYELQIAQSVYAYQASQRLGSSFQIVATARAGHTLAELEQVIQEEVHKLQIAPPTTRELGRAVNQYEASFLGRLEGISNKADLLNNYFIVTGNPDYFQEDLSRYRALDPTDIQSVVATHLGDHNRVVLSVVPQGHKELAATTGKEGK